MRIFISLVVPAAIVAGVSAQETRTIDSIPYGPAPVTIEGRDAGARWDSPWLGVDGTHPTGLLSYWDFEGTVVDSGPFASHGVPMGNGYANDVPALAPWSGMSLSLTSANQEYVDLNQHLFKYANLNHGTIACWVKTSSSGALTVLGASDANDASHEIALSLSNGRPWFDVRGDLNSWQQVFTATTINDGVWHHMAAVVEPNGVSTLYVDGLAVDTRHQGFFRYVFDLNVMSIGRNVDWANGAQRPQWYFDGLIDDLAIWGTPLTAGEVTALAGGMAPPLAYIGATVPPNPIVEAGSLASPAHASQGLIASGNKLVSTSLGRAGRQFTDHFDLSTDAVYYMSCLIRREDNNGVIEPGTVEFTDPGTTRGMFGWDAAGTWFVGGGTPATGPGTMQPNTAYFCVLRLDAVSSGTADVAYLKAFAPGDVVPVDDTGLMGVGTGANQWTAQTLPYGSNADMGQFWLTPTGTNKIELDEIRFGTSWQSVVRLSYGQGCGGADISHTGRPVLGSSFSVDLTGGVANGLGGLLLGFSRDNSNLGALPLSIAPLGGPAGCFLLQSNQSSVLTTLDGSGSGSVALGIPPSQLLYGLALFAQWAALDPALGVPLPVRASPGLEILLQN